MDKSKEAFICESVNENQVPFLVYQLLEVFGFVNLLTFVNKMGIIHKYETHGPLTSKLQCVETGKIMEVLQGYNVAYVFMWLCFKGGDHGHIVATIGKPLYNWNCHIFMTW